MDMTTKVVIDILRLPTGSDASLDHDSVFVPHEPKEYHHDLQSQATRIDLKPLIVHQPEGVSFTIDGYLIKWQKWRFRLGFTWREGMVLHDVTYDGRELFHRLSLSEMFVPYGDPRYPYSRKSVFDVGDIGAGVAANNLALGCDCLGVVKVIQSHKSAEIWLIYYPVLLIRYQQFSRTTGAKAKRYMHA